MIKFSSIKLVNFMSFLDMEFDFNPHGLNLIYGKVGVGKSSIADALVWCLFGKTRKGVVLDGIVNRMQKKNCSVTLKFSEKENNYCLTRYRKHEKFKNLITLSVNGNEFEVVEQDEIDSVIGITYDLFVIANVISSGDPSSNILELKSQRNAIFEEIFGLSGLEKYEKQIVSGIKKIKDELDTMVRDLSELRTKYNTIQKSIQDFENQKEQKAQEIDKILIELEEKKTELSSVNISEADRIIKTIDKLNSELFDIEQKRLKIEASLNAAFDSVSIYTDRAEKIINQRNIILKSVCYVCEQPLNKEKTGEMTNALDEELNELKENIEKIQKLIVEAEAVLVEEETKKENVKLKIDKAEKKLMNIFSFSEEDPYDLYKNFTQKEEKINREIAVINRMKADLEFGEFIKKQKTDAEKAAQMLPELERKEDELKDELRYWQFWKDASDIKMPGNYKTWRIKNIINDFNSILSEYIKMFFKDDEIKNIEIKFNDDLTEVITVGGEEQVYHLFSKGQRKKLNNAVNFSFYKMVRRFVKPLPFLFVDEAMDGLDDASQNAVMDYLQHLALDAAVYIISHNDVIKNSIDKAYMVYMEKETSKIEEMI